MGEGQERLDDVVAGWLAERYAPSVWWPRQAYRPVCPPVVHEDTPLVTKQRRQRLEQAARSMDDSPYLRVVNE